VTASRRARSEESASGAKKGDDLLGVNDAYELLVGIDDR
jgi:hypothetical protein